MTKRCAIRRGWTKHRNRRGSRDPGCGAARLRCLHVPRHGVDGALAQLPKARPVTHTAGCGARRLPSACTATYWTARSPVPISRQIGVAIEGRSTETARDVHHGEHHIPGCWRRSNTDPLGVCTATNPRRHDGLPRWPASGRPRADLCCTAHPQECDALHFRSHRVIPNRKYDHPEAGVTWTRLAFCWGDLTTAAREPQRREAECG